MIWEPVKSLIKRLRISLAKEVTVDANNIAQVSASVGSYISFNGKVYKVITAIVANTTDLSTPSTYLANISDGALNDIKAGVATDLATKVDKTTTVNGHALSSDVTVSKGDVGLGNVDNTADAAKPISTATQAALDNKANSSDVYSKTEINGVFSDIADLLEQQNTNLTELYENAEDFGPSDETLADITNEIRLSGLYFKEMAENTDPVQEGE